MVYVPAQAWSEGNLPVLYMHDGQNLFAPDAVFGGWRVGWLGVLGRVGVLGWAGGLGRVGVLGWAGVLGRVGWFGRLHRLGGVGRVAVRCHRYSLHEHAGRDNATRVNVDVALAGIGSVSRPVRRNTWGSCGRCSRFVRECRRVRLYARREELCRVGPGCGLCHLRSLY